MGSDLGGRESLFRLPLGTVKGEGHHRSKNREEHPAQQQSSTMACTCICSYTDTADFKEFLKTQGGDPREEPKRFPVPRPHRTDLTKLR